MVKKLYEVRNRSGDLILENVTSGEIKEELHCTTAQVNNARASGDRIFGEYKVEEIDRKLSRKTDFELLLEFESICDRLLSNGKGKKMNKRQKKKLFKQVTGKKPPKKMKYSGKSYHRAINKPWGGKKTTVNYSWDCEKLKEIATQFTKAWAGTRVTIEKASDALTKLFAGIGINISEVPESSYAVNTRNVVNTTKTLTAHRRKRGEWN
jgi:hypothetical protein